MRTNILYVIQNDVFGGGERGFSQLIRGLNQEKFRIIVATTPKGRFYQEIRNSAADVIQVPFNRLDIFNAINNLQKLIKKEKIHIVHSQGARADFFARIASSLGKPTLNISTVQMPVEGFNVSRLQKFVYTILDRFSEQFVDRFIVPSTSLKQHLIRKHGVNATKISLIYNGVELDQYNPKSINNVMRKEWGVSRNTPCIGSIGRMVWQKGFEYLIQSIPEVVQAVPDAKFMFVGDGPLKGKLGALSEELGVRDKIIFAGFRADIMEVLSAVDLLVVPSLLEGFPMITLEAMAMAKPIVATSIDGITEQIADEENGILVPPKDHRALSGAILRLIQDEEYSKMLGMAARKKVEKEFSVERIVAETEKVYLSLLYPNSR